MGNSAVSNNFFGGRATILDAFNAAAGVTQQALGHLTKEKEYELDNELFRQNLDLETLQKQLIADYDKIDPESGEKPFQQNPEEYAKHVQQKLENWKKDANAAGAKLALGKAGQDSRGSKYYADRLDRMYGQGNAVMFRRTQAVMEEAARRKVDIDYAKTDAEIDNAGLGIQETLNLKMNNLERRKGVNALDPVEEYKERARIANAGFKQALNVDIGGKNIAQAYKEIDDNLKSLEESWSRYLGEGETLDGFLDKKQELLGDARQAVRLAIWKRDYNEGKALNAEYNRIAHDALKSDNPLLIGEAQRRWREGSLLRERALASIESENPEYNPENKDEIAGWFPMVGDLFGGGRGSGGADEIKKAALAGKLKELLSEVVAGRGGEFGSVHDFNQKFKGMLYKWANDSGFYGGGQESFEVEFADVMEQFYDYAAAAVKESPEALSAITMAEKYTKELAGDKARNAMFMGKKYSNVGANAAAAIMSGLMDEIYTFDNRNSKQGGAAFFDAVTEMLGVINAETVQALGETGKKGDDSLIDMVEALENRHIVHTNEHGQTVTMPGPADDPGRMSKWVENSRNVLGKRIAEIKGLDYDKLVAHNRKDLSNYDEDASPEFQYDGGSDWYRWSVETKDGKKQLTLEKRSGLNGEWKKDTVADRAAADKAADKDFLDYYDSYRTSEEKTRETLNSPGKVNEMIEEGLNPLTGEKIDFDYNTTPPPFRGGRGLGKSEEEWAERYLKMDARSKQRAWANYYEVEFQKTMEKGR